MHFVCYLFLAARKIEFNSVHIYFLQCIFISSPLGQFLFLHQVMHRTNYRFVETYLGLWLERKGMARLLLDPVYSHILLQSRKYDCVPDIVTTVAMLSAELDNECIVQMMAQKVSWAEKVNLLTERMIEKTVLLKNEDHINFK